MWMTQIFYFGLVAGTILLASIVSPKPVHAYQLNKKGKVLHNTPQISQDKIGMIQNCSREKIKDRVALLSIFLILTTVLILRVNIGNDYYRYTQILHELRYDGYVITEPGFNLVCRFILKTKIWWDAGYILCFAVFGIATMVFMLKALYDLSENFFVTFTMFMLLGMYFQTFSTMRYYLALAIVMYSIKYLLNKRFVTFVILVLLAASFHKIALFAIPVYLLAMIPWKKWHIGVFFVIAVQFLLFQDFYLKIMLKLYPSYVGETQFLAGGTSLANVLRCVSVFLLSLYYYKKCIKDQPKNRFFFYLNLAAVVLYTFCYYVPVISRIGYLLNISQLFLLPAFVQAEENTSKRRILIGLIIIAGLAYYVLFRNNMVESLRIVPYQTWVFQDMTPINMLVQ